VTVSDRASAGTYEDKGGPAIAEVLGEILVSSWQPVTRLVPDDIECIAAALAELADAESCSLIFTTGGTGPALRDVTPEATQSVCDKILPGFGELMRQRSLAQ